jgi:hypothetical protein
VFVGIAIIFAVTVAAGLYREQPGVPGGSGWAWAAAGSVFWGFAVLAVKRMESKLRLEDAQARLIFARRDRLLGPVPPSAWDHLRELVKKVLDEIDPLDRTLGGLLPGDYGDAVNGIVREIDDRRCLPTIRQLEMVFRFEERRPITEEQAIKLSEALARQIEQARGTEGWFKS